MEENIVICILFGFFIGRYIGYLTEKYTTKIDGHEEVNKYMSNNYGELWNTLNINK